MSFREIKFFIVMFRPLINWPCGLNIDRDTNLRFLGFETFYLKLLGLCMKRIINE